MADPRVVTHFEGDEKGQQAAIGKLQASMEKLRETNATLSKESHEHHYREEGLLSRGNDLLKEQLSNVKNIVVGYVGATEVVGKLMEAQERYNRLLEEGAHASTANAHTLMGALAAAGQTADADFWQGQLKATHGTDAAKNAALIGSVQDTFGLSREQKAANFAETMRAGIAAGDQRQFAAERGALRHMLPGLAEDDYTDLTIAARQKLGGRQGEILNNRNMEMIRRLRDSGAFGRGPESADLALGFQIAGIDASSGTRGTLAVEALLTQRIEAQRQTDPYKPLDTKQQTLERLRPLSAQQRREYLEAHPDEVQNVIPANEVGSTLVALKNYRAVGGDLGAARAGDLTTGAREGGIRSAPGQILASDVATHIEQQRIRDKYAAPGRFVEDAGNRFENTLTDPASGYGAGRYAEAWIARKTGQAIGWLVGLHAPGRAATGQQMAAYALEGGNGGPLTRAAEESMRELIRMQAQQLEESRRQTKLLRKGLEVNGEAMQRSRQMAAEAQASNAKLSSSE